MILALFLVLLYISGGICSDNGLGRTPPMGWLSWVRFRCNIDCQKYPTECISENLIMVMADQMSQRFRDAGYTYVMVDDCWLAKSRASNGSLLPDPVRFSRGMKFLTNYVHNKGLKFGIYEDCGLFTCAGYPGSLLHLKQDAQTFTEWEVDYVKFDGCYSPSIIQLPAIERFSDYLNKTGRPIFLNVEWPLYYKVKDAKPDQVKILQETTNMARVYDDIQDNWQSLLSIVEFYKNNANNFSAWAQPGHFNDPDMLLIGNNYLTDAQEKLQMTMWSMFAAPLIMSNDLRNISEVSVSILTNRNIIALNQDCLGIQGTYIKTINGVQLWKRILSNGRHAIALMNPQNTDESVTFSLNDLNIVGQGLFALVEVYEAALVFKVTQDKPISIRIDATSAEVFYCQKA